MRALLTLLLGWLALAAGAALILSTVTSPPRPTGDETRILTYPVDGPLRFAVEAGTEEVKLVTWLVGPERWARDPRQTSVYCLRLAFSDAEGAPISDEQLWVRARGGQVQGPGGRVFAPARLPDTHAWISDDRLTRVDLVGALPRGGVLEVEPCWTPPEHRVLAIAFQRTLRTDAERIRVTRGQSDAFRANRAARVSSRDWQDLPASWQDNVATWRWDRLGALPGGDGLVPTQELYTAFARGSWWDEAALGLPLVPGAAMAFNLEGPTLLHARWYTLDGHPAGPQPTQLELRRADGSGEILELGEVDELDPIEISEGVVSAHVALSPRAEGPAVLRAWTSAGDLDRAWGDPPRAPIDARGQQAVAPDLRNLEVYRALPSGQAEPLRFAVAEEEWLRLRLFTPLPPELPGLLEPQLRVEPDGPLVTLRALDAEGELLASWTARSGRQPSVFERYTQVESPDSAAVSEPETVYLHPPPGVAWLEIQADAPVDISLRTTRTPDEPTVTWRGYEDIDAMRARGRWVPLVFNPWRARAPEDVEALLRAGRAPRVDAQVRLEGQRPRDPTPRFNYEGLPLREPFELIAEPDTDGNPSRGARARVTARGVRLATPASRRLLVDYRVPRSALGQPAPLEINGVPLEEVLISTGGTLTLDELPPEGVTLRATGEGVWLARAVAAPMWEVRRVVATWSGHEELLPLPGGEGRLNLYVYANEAGGTLRWTLEATPKAGLIEDLSTWTGEVRLDALGGRAQPLSFAGAELLPLTPARILLGQDFPEEGGTLRFTIEDNPGPIYVRATATWATGAADPVGARRIRSGP
ncbi:MAG: hypothetical protein H6740_12285 [Alphaproteobacteria bacterium]|nr:hypothetical protein [Alphaproteobacteria bacterium]